MSFDPYEFDRDYSPANRRVVTEGEYTTRTFLWMVLGLMITFGVAVVGWITNLTLYVYVYAPFVQLAVLIATLVMAFTMSARIEKMSVGTARSIFVAFSALFGFTLSIYLYVYRLDSIILVFLATALYFGVLAAYGHFTKRNLAGIGPILFSGKSDRLAVQWKHPGTEAQLRSEILAVLMRDSLPASMAVHFLKRHHIRFFGRDSRRKLFQRRQLPETQVVGDRFQPQSILRAGYRRTAQQSQQKANEKRPGFFHRRPVLVTNIYKDTTLLYNSAYVCRYGSKNEGAGRTTCAFVFYVIAETTARPEPVCRNLRPKWLFRKP